MEHRAKLKKPSHTDWQRVDKMKDKDIDFTDIPELGPEFFKRATRWPGIKKQITLRIDPDVLAFFRRKGPRYQTMINNVLRGYMDGESRR
jgi:uncharacterized protein (DUF4415 family)